MKSTGSFVPILASLAAALLGGAGCSAPELRHLSHSLPPTIDGTLGCWSVEARGWRPAHLAVPVQVRLDSASMSTDLTGPTPYRRAVVLAPHDSAARLMYRHTVWAPTTRDSVYLVLSTGFEGVVLTLSLDERSLTGRGQTFVDYPAPSQRGTVVGSRISCPD